jgi:hypothetical protein
MKECIMDQSINRNASWWEHCQSAVEETDLNKAQEKVYLAEEALFRRWQTIAGDPNHHNERNEMAQASNKLLRVKTERLHWPYIKS